MGKIYMIGSQKGGVGNDHDYSESGIFPAKDG